MRSLQTKIVNWGVRDLAAADELVRNMRRLSARSRMFDGDLAAALVVRAGFEISAKQWPAALASVEEVLALPGRAPRVRLRSWGSQVANAHFLRAEVLRELGRCEEASRAAEEAVARRRALVEAGGGRFELSYAVALRSLASSYGCLERYEDAARAGELSAAVGRRVLARGVDHDVWTTLVAVSDWLWRLDRAEEAARCAQEAVGLLRGRRSAATEVDLAVALLNLGASLGPARPEEALRATDEAIALWEGLVDRAPSQYERYLLRARDNRVVQLERLGLPAERVLGPYPLCERCRAVNGGLVATRHRQVHVAAHGRESCVDERLAEIMPKLWAVCETTSCCQDDGDPHDGAATGRAYVMPAAGQSGAAEMVLVELGFVVENVGGRLTFVLPEEPTSPARG
jgi:tetratricopeptide (TPR) repeat protein